MWTHTPAAQTARKLLPGAAVEETVANTIFGATFPGTPLLCFKARQDVIIYTKTLENGITFYVEEIRLGRHELAASTLYKRKKDDSPTLID